MTLPTKDRDLDAVTDAAPQALMRENTSLTVFDARWLWSIVVAVPILLSAGVYWLHQQPGGPQSRASGPIVEVRLVQEAVRALAAEAVRPDQNKSEGRPETLIEAPNRPIPEETTTTASAPPSAVPAPSAGALSPASAPRPITSGAVSAFQRALLNHISRFRRYPSTARAGQHGVAMVVFAMRRDGKVIEVFVRKSSGDLVLDEAAIETVRRAQPLPSIPVDLPDRLTILLPISFDAP